MNMNIDLRLGDCLEVLKTLPDNSVDAVITDGPYGLEFMGKEWDSFKEGRMSKYKDGGEVNIDGIKSRSGKGGAGPQYTKRAAARCKNCGRQRWSGNPCDCDEPDFEIDNSSLRSFQSFCEAWATQCYRVLKPGGHMLSFGGSRTYHRMASGVEDAGFEIRDQILFVYGSGFPKSLNIGKAIDKKEGNERKVVGLRTDGAGNKNSNNIMYDEEHKFVAEKIFKETKGNSEWEGFGTGLKPAHEDIVLAKKDGDDLMEIDTQPGFYYGAKCSKKDRNEGLDGFEKKQNELIGQLNNSVRENGTIRTTPEPKQNHHPTVKPTDLMKYLIKLITPPNGVVLDPFMGSGSTGKAAVSLGYSFIGIEREQEYFDIAEARINHEKNKPKQGELY